MTAGAAAPSVAAAAGAEGFRGRVRAALGAFGTDVLARWEQERHVPREAVAELGRRGIFRERWDAGAEGGVSRMIALSEESSLRSSGLALAIMGHSEMFTGALQWLATSPRQRALLEDALDGRVAGCFAATEPHGGSSLAAIRTMATAAGDGWRLQGCKRYVSNIGGASHVLVLARPQTPQQAGDLGLFVVPLAAAGVTVDGFFRASGIDACDLGQVTIDAQLPADALLGQLGLGLLYASHLLTFERVWICAQLLTAAETALRLTTAYARQRSAGGARLFDQQLIRHRLARCRADLWNLQTRLSELAGRAAEGQGMPAREIAALKLTAGESAGHILDTCMQVLGARGCTSNFPLARLWRECRLARLGGGTDEVLAEVVAAGLDRPDRAFDDLLCGYLAADIPEPDPDHQITCRPPS